MKAAVIRRYGGPEEFQYADVRDPIPGPGQILVKVAAAGINPVDILERTGGTKDWNPLQFPAVLGWDVSGTVAKVGDGVRGFAVGDKVCAWSYHTYAELCADKAELFAKVPEGLDVVDAAALPLVTLTGSQLISAASGVKPGDTVFVSGAAGSVARSAVYMAKKKGATVIAGVRKQQLGQSESIGADRVIALDDAAAFAALPRVDVVANTLRGEPGFRLMSKVKDGGTFATVTGDPDNASDYPSVRVASFVSTQGGAMLRSLLEAVRDKQLTIPIDRRILLSEAGAGHAAVEKGGIGKVLLLP